MVQAYKIKPDQQKSIPAVTHADGTGRLQTVERNVNPLYWELIDVSASSRGVPILLNTSFNENEPIVNTPREALECFLRTQMDVLVVGSYLLLKTENMRHSETRRAFTGCCCACASTGCLGARSRNTSIPHNSRFAALKRGRYDAPQRS